MNTKKLDPMRIIGLQCRTTHGTQEADIGALWARAGRAGVLTGAQGWAVYSDYERTEDGFSVTVTVGSPADADAAVPEGQAAVQVPAQSCAWFDTDGSIPAVQAAWGEIWQRWPDGGPRSFVADLERWNPGPDGQPERAEVFVGLR